MRKFFQNLFAAQDKIKLLEEKIDFVLAQNEKLEAEKQQLMADKKRLETRIFAEIKANRLREDELQAIIVEQAAGRQRLTYRETLKDAVTGKAETTTGDEADDELKLITISDFEYTEQELLDRATELYEQAQQRGEKYPFEELVEKMRENPQVYLDN